MIYLKKTKFKFLFFGLAQYRLKNYCCMGTVQKKHSAVIRLSRPFSVFMDAISQIKSWYSSSLQKSKWILFQTKFLTVLNFNSTTTKTGLEFFLWILMELGTNLKEVLKKLVFNFESFYYKKYNPKLQYINIYIYIKKHDRTY